MRGLYIHIPFCARKCQYCDFVSFSGMESSIDAYLDAVGVQMRLYVGAAVDTVFIGGGTPSFLSVGQLQRLLDMVSDNFDIAADAEFTVECNPDSISEEKAHLLLRGGVNRVSVGVQSFDDTELLAIGRIHNAETAYNAVTMLSRCGFSNISIDLMASLPHQTAESFKKTLERSVSLPIKHISVYSLIIEDGTPLKAKYESGEYELPDDDTDRELYAYTARFLQKYGFSRYEISNYAMPHYESRHNINYWDCGEYIGIGAAAHSYLDGARFANTSDVARYINGDFCGGDKEILSENDKIGEFMMLGLRKTKGIDEAEFMRRFGKSIDDVFGVKIDRFVKLGVIKRSDGAIRLTDRGFDVANTVLCEFI